MSEKRVVLSTDILHTKQSHEATTFKSMTDFAEDEHWICGSV